MRYDDTVIDGHVHYAWPIDPQQVDTIRQKTGADVLCLAVLSHFLRLSPNPDALLAKHRSSGVTYVFGCLDASDYILHKHSFGRYFVRHTKRLLKMGCDGVKMIEGKPQYRRELQVPDFDLPVWEPFFAYAERTALPILWHVNDPETFWDQDNMPSFAKAQGWGYGPDDVNNEEQYRQILAVLDRHPKLSVTFAHMFFLSAQLPRLTKILEKYENVRVDLTPGIELYENLSNTPAETAAFFSRFGERILYGTDIGGRAVLNGEQTVFNEKESLRRAEICKAFLTGGAPETISSDGAFLVHNPPFVLRPLHLDNTALKNIFFKNFRRFAGENPRPVQLPAVRRECYRLKARIRRLQRRGITKFCDVRGIDDVLRLIKEDV